MRSGNTEMKWSDNLVPWVRIGGRRTLLRFPKDTVPLRLRLCVNYVTKFAMCGVDVEDEAGVETASHLK
jgi:hypothetical protein